LSALERLWEADARQDHAAQRACWVDQPWSLAARVQALDGVESEQLPALRVDAHFSAARGPFPHASTAEIPVAVWRIGNVAWAVTARLRARAGYPTAVGTLYQLAHDERHGWRVSARVAIAPVQRLSEALASERPAAHTSARWPRPRIVAAAIATGVASALLVAALTRLLASPVPLAVRRVFDGSPRLFLFAAAVGGALSVLALANGLRTRARAQWASAGVLLSACIALAAQAQLSARAFERGVLLYGVAVAIALASSLAARVMAPPTAAGGFANEFDGQQWSWRRDGITLVLVLSIAAFARIYLVGAYPYGIEGDEAKWTWSVFDYSLVGDKRAWPAYAFVEYAPLSFWYEAAVMRLFGATVFVARGMVACASIVATAAFYLLVRRMAGWGVAAVATVLLAVSIGDVSASRLGNIEGQIKLWSILAPLCAVLGLRRPSPLWLLASGLSLAAGMLTYDTFDPIAAIVGLYTAALLIARLLREPKRWQLILTSAAAFAVGVAPALPTKLAGMYARRVVYLGLVSGSAGGGGFAFPPPPEVIARVREFWGRSLGDLLTTLFVQERWNDFLLIRDGPIVNAALLPFFALGIGWCVAWLGSRGRHQGLSLLWFILAFFPVPILIGATWFRVLYPALPAFYVLAAVGIWQAYRALGLALPSALRPAATAILAAGIAVLAVVNLQVYFHEIRDPEERKITRELADTLTGTLGASQMVYLPSVTGKPDLPTTHKDFIDFVAQGRVGIGRHAAHYERVGYEELLRRLSLERASPRTVSVIAEAAQRDYGAERGMVVAALQRCFPSAQRTPGRFVDRFDFSAAALANPRCVSDASARLDAPAANATLPALQPMRFAWSVERGTATAFRVQVERRNPRLIQVEAEDFSQDQGWMLETRYVNDYQGAGFLADARYRAGPANRVIDVPTAGTYELWVRSYRRTLDDTHVYLQATGQQGEFARSDPARLNRWVWDSLGRLDLPAGPLSLQISKDFGTVPHTSIFVDTVILSADPQFHPDRRTLWDIVADTGPEPVTMPTYVVGGEDWIPGAYRWRVQLLDGDWLVDGLGRTGIWTAPSPFAISP